MPRRGDPDMPDNPDEGTATETAHVEKSEEEDKSDDCCSD
jgi:hypothetical protein